MNEYRTHNCGEIRKENVGQRVKIAGWVHAIRDLGGLVFMHVRDQYGITQCVISGESNLVETVSRIPTESTVSVEGIVRSRDEHDINKDMPTGEVEVVIDKVEILGKRLKPLPFEVNSDIEAREDLRLQYRFLDLRNEKLRNNILLRSKIIQFLRAQMIERGFTEVQTPILTSSSPEGARDYLVPSRVHPGRFYALPQAPQQFKQLLMVSGIDKYFQIAPCFRDEDARADRAPGEFYQLDMEMAFATQEDVFAVMEKVMYDTFVKFSNKKVSEYPFPRITYRDAMLKYGSDKPDLRNPLIIQDVTDIFKDTEFNAFKDKTIRVIVTPNAANSSRKFFDKMVEFATEECNAKGLAWVKVNEDGSYQGSIAKFITEKQAKLLNEKTGLKPGDAIFFIADEEDKVSGIAGEIRKELGNR